MQRWHRELAASIGVLPEHPATNRELLDGALRLSRVLEAGGSATPEVVTAAVARAIN